jgi:hypothetical protein
MWNKSKKSNRSIELRELTVEDFDNLSDLIEELVKKTGEDAVKKMIDSRKKEKEKETKKESGENEDDSISLVVGIGMDILQTARKFLKNEAMEFLASLIGKTPEQFKKMPIDTPLRILKAIRTAPEAEIFFTMPSLQFNMTEWLENTLRVVKERYGLGSEEEKKNS